MTPPYIWDPPSKEDHSPADSRAFGARYSSFALVAYFSRTVLNRVFDKDWPKLNITTHIKQAQSKLNAQPYNTKFLYNKKHAPKLTSN